MKNDNNKFDALGTLAQQVVQLHGEAHGEGKEGH